MIFQEPKMEFVPIDLTIDATDNGSQAGYETCTGPLAPSNLCNYNKTFWLDENGNQYSPDSGDSFTPKTHRR